MDSNPDILITDDDDPGDDVQRRFRYQHAYGVILISDMMNEHSDYESLYFEHHEDILGSKPNGCIDYFQIKTRKPELGYWCMQDSALLSSLKRFYDTDQKFPDQSSTFSFVSNCEFLVVDEESKDHQRVATSPINFFNYISGKHKAEVEPEYDKQFEKIVKYCECDDKKKLKNTLSKVQLRIGPPLDGFDAIVSTEYIAKIANINDQPLPVIHRIRDELIFKIFKASSLPLSPESYTFDILSQGCANPKIAAKRIGKDSIQEEISALLSPKFHFAEGVATTTLGTAESKVGIIEKKFARSGLQSYFEIFKRRSISAEASLIKMSYEDIDNFNSKLDQIESTVLSICKDAELENSNNKNQINSIAMLREVSHALKKLATTDPRRVYNSDYELLLGVAGLLTGDCKIWWTEIFDLGEES